MARWALGVLAGVGAVACLAFQARADWRDDLPVLRIGVMTGENAGYRLAQADPFRRYLEAKLALPVELVPAGGYEALIDAMKTARIQYGIFSAMAYTLTAAECDCVEPVAVPVMPDGATGFHAVLVVRVDSTVSDLAAAKGGRLAVASPASYAGRIMPLGFLAAEGFQPDRYFSSLVERPDPVGAVRALLAGEADIAAAWEAPGGAGLIAELAASGEAPPGTLRIVWRSPLIPGGPHVLRKSVPQELKTLVAEALTSVGREFPNAVDAINRNGAVGFAPVAPSAYEPLRKLLPVAKVGP